MKILIATKNPGKFAEFKVLLADLPVELVSLKDMAIEHEVIEDGQTFEENAIKKAKEYCQLSGLPTIADDGGLEIDALAGEPGVHSRRWFGYKMTDQQLIKAVLRKMKNVPLSKRTAQMRTVLALALPDKDQIVTSEGKIDVIIAEKPAAKIIEGYPYRSLMIIPKINQYFVDISFEEQSKFSHRGLAIKKLKQIIQKLLR